MFGLFEKKAPPGSFILVAVKSAMILRQAERENGGLMTPPEAIDFSVRAVAKRISYDLSGQLAEVTKTCVMCFLMEEKFIDKLLARDTGGTVNLTVDDEKQIDRIVGHLLK
jgi:hypothetical protein